MTRWIMIALGIAGFAIAFVTKSPGMMGLGVVLGFIGMIGAVFAIAADRVSSNTRPESAMLSTDDLAAIKARANAQAARMAAARNAAADAAKSGPAQPTR